MGDTTLDPFTATVPMPWLMLAEVASVVVQERVVELPRLMGFGAAVMSTVGTWCTITLTLSNTEPAALTAVMV